ncbi:diguanylate cyclase (GGDEF)-like protein [Pararhizobium capsulatum DSM 1112]|uniref:diguanylate cyclase n=1 Tax=Pararhizobium capsulatum DSM 1112 TaxID=1121113 RepID=A0ABU0BNV9_9HYPH|nr:sensor domain-containing diguanylate cyclase [Pararhizobium capsulatum]MDQ0319419.1 diguanylate cyclase (GGDEF)-like protein [Pararhizobium capsulatum DSM 1112]
MVVTKAFGRSSAEVVQRESERLAALSQLDLLDTPRDEGFERVVRLIKSIFSIDIGLVSLIDAHRQWYAACSGLAATQVPREDSFCRYVIDNEEPIVVPDTTKDIRFAQHPAVTGETHIRFYAGVPLKTKAGHTIGTVCAIDRRARSFSSRDLTILQELSGAAMDRIELMQSAATDSLTEALTRRAFKQEADQLISLARRHQHDLSCIVLDIDHFKRVNDTHGHAAGDDALKAVACACRTVLRAGDLFGRLGGEEFAVLLPHIDRNGAEAVAEKLRLVIASQAVSGAYGTLNVTASLGSTSLSIIGKDVDTLLAQADAAMYRAKNEGRNRCVSWSSMSAEDGMNARRRVLKAGSILFNDRRSTIDCTVRSLGSDGASLSVSASTGIPAEFVLLIKGEGFETRCRMITNDRQNLEVAFC